MVRSSLPWQLLLVVPLFVLGCNGGSERLNVAIDSAVPRKLVFDSSTATARVFGSVLLEGKSPELPSMTVGGDRLCQLNAVNIRNDKAIVASGGKVRNAIIYVRAGHERHSYSVPDEAAVLDQQGCIYTPHVLTVMKGQKLRILNGDETFHNVHAHDGERSEFNIGQPSKGSEDTKVFSHAAMPFRMGCDFHKWMNAYVGVFDHPFHTTSGDSGTYEMRLPAGKYEVVAWHEKYGEQSSKLDVPENGAVNLDFKFTAAP